MNNSEEKELIVMLQATKLVKHFINGKLLDAKELANMKRGSTFIMKAITSVLDRLGRKQLDKFLRLAKNSTVVVVTDTELQILKKRKSAEITAAFEDSKEYFDLVEITMDLNCKNCTKHCKDCDLYKHFDEQEMIPLEEEHDLENCKFAYKR